MVGLMVLNLMALVSMAYNENHTLENESVTFNDLPNRFTDAFINEKNDQQSEFITAIPNWLYFLFAIVLVALLLEIWRRFF
jgi:hypothetical protein